MKLSKLGSGLALAASTLLVPLAQAETVKMLATEPNIQAGKDYFAGIKKAFEAKNPGITVQIDYMDDTSFKAKLPTLLQSSARPDVFYTWTGGVFFEQAKAGILKDIGSEMNAGWKDVYSPAGVNALTYKGKVYGAPMYAASVVLWYNKKLLAQAKVDPASIQSWDDFLAAVSKVKAAGITPIVVGGKDKWPLQFYYGYLATRIAGKDGIANADAGTAGGFENPDFVRAGSEFKRLIDLKPFQPGFMDTNNNKAAGLFGDGKGAFHLMGNWLYGSQQKNSTSGKGIADEELGFIRFPAVKGGKGKATDTFGGINGWLVTKDASPAATKWLKFLLSKENQIEGGRLGLWLPIARDAGGGVANPLMRQIVGQFDQAEYHQLYLDQALGASVGATLNDVAAELATAEITPKEAAERVEEARRMR
jgi:raffinose/stachyose/melibiose transport system substrate-binding protein